MKTKKPNHGGKRANAGRPLGIPNKNPKPKVPTKRKVGLQKHGNINMVLDVVALIAFVAVFMILILI